MSYGPGTYAGPNEYQVVEIHNNVPPSSACVLTYQKITQGTCWHVIQSWRAPCHGLRRHRRRTHSVRHRNFSPWYSWMVRLQAQGLDDPLPTEGGRVLEEWRVRCRTRLGELLGPMPDRVPLELETLESVECDGYRRHKIVFDTEETMSVPAYLLVPDGRVTPGPAVLAAHGHGPGKALVCGLAETPAPNGDYAVQLVRRGYVVLAPDMRCFGEREPTGTRRTTTPVTPTSSTPSWPARAP